MRVHACVRGCMCVLVSHGRRPLLSSFEISLVSVGRFPLWMGSRFFSLSPEPLWSRKQVQVAEFGKRLPVSLLSS